MSLEEANGLHETICKLPSLGWYYGNLTVEQAEKLLKNESDGAFLIRDSSDSDDIRDIFTITFKIQNCFGSVRIDYAKGYFSLSLQDPGLPLFRTLMDLVEHCLERSLVHKQPVCILTGHQQHHNVSLYLVKPVSRHVQNHSLQYLCREAIHKYVTRDKITELGLPNRLMQNYVLNNPFFDEQLFSDCDSLHEEDSVSQGTENSGASGSIEINTAGNRS